MKEIIRPFVLASVLGAASLQAEVPASQSLPSDAQISAASAEEIATLNQGVAALRQQLRQNTAAIKAVGVASDALLAEQVTIRESLLLKERRLKQLKFAQREAGAGGEAEARHELQRALVQADGPEARALLLARHRAYQQALASEKALQSRDPETTSATTP